MNKIQKIINKIEIYEGISNSDRKILVGYAVEILGKLPDDANLKRALDIVMLNMTLTKNNPNFKNTSMFMPNKFDKEFFDDIWTNIPYAQQETVFKQAIKKIGL